MFERFTKAARTVVILAQEEARQRRDPQIGTEHLLLGLLGVHGGPAAPLLEQVGVDRRAVESALRERTADAEALATLGIDLDEVRRRAEEAFGPGALDGRRRWRAGHIPFEAHAKKVLELALREAIRIGDRHIGTEHLLLGLLHPGTGRAQRILDGHGVTLDLMRRAVDELGRGAASG
ncbi:MAG: Clp protease N-terminal domain-containing protein [Pseudonocardia sp.]